MAGINNFLEMFWFQANVGGPRSIQPKLGYILGFPYMKIDTALMITLEKHFSSEGSNIAKMFFRSIRQFNIFILISGDITQYADFEGPCKVRYIKRYHTIYCDIYIPEERWANHNATEYQHYYADMMQQGLQLCLQRAKKEKDEVLDEYGFVDRYEAAIKEFLEMDFSHITEMDGDMTDFYKQSKQIEEEQGIPLNKYSKLL